MKKRILSILTVMAMLLSMCAVSVYAEDVDLTTITAPVTYEYTVTDVPNSTVTPENGKFGKTSKEQSWFVECETPSKNSKVTFNGDSKNKLVTTGQKIKFTCKVAGDPWTTGDYALVYVGFYISDNGGLYTAQLRNHKGELDKMSSNIKGTITSDKVNAIPAPEKNWVQYDMVLEIGKSENKLSLYSDGQAHFTDVVIKGKTASESIDAFGYVTTPGVQWYTRSKCAFHLADVSMTIYPANYEGTIIEDYPIPHTGSDFKEEFKEEEDGSLTYTGMQALSTSEVSKIVNPDWTAEYKVSDNIGYIKMTKGDTVYYEKVADRVNGFTLADVDTSAGEKRLSVKVKNVDAEGSVSPVLLLASYNGSNLVKVAISNAVTIDAGKTGTLTANLMVAAEENVSEIRAFLLDSKGSLIPIKSVISKN